VTTRGDDDALGPFDPAFLASLARLAFAVRREKARAGEGAARPDRRGGRVEFADHRAYVPGDDPRFVDWAAYARTGRFFVKEFEREDDLSVVVLVDTSASMGLHGKLRAALRIAYALAYLGLAAGSRVRAGLLAEGGLRLSGEVAGKARLRGLARFLASASADGTTDLRASLARMPEAARGSRVVVLLSDLLTADDGRAVLAARVRRGDDVSVVHLWCAEDQSLPAGRPLVLEDAETGERLSVPADAAVLAGRDAARREQAWHEFAARHRMGYVPVDASAPTEEVVLRWLRAGGVVA
jgi:uncharacterized protein (DUF58 family)